MPATAYQPSFKERFERIADATPPLSDKQIDTQLTQDPSIDPKVYYLWCMKRQIEKRTASLVADPIDFDKVLRSTKYDDPQSLSALVNTLNAPGQHATLPIGNVKQDDKQVFFFLLPLPGKLPRDFDNWVGRGDPSIGQTVLDPTDQSSKIPQFFVQVGCLLATNSSSTPDPNDDTSSWIIVVDPNRQAYAFFNPLSSFGEEPLFGSDPKQRPLADTFPGTTKAATAMRFNTTVDNLLQSSGKTWSFTEDANLMILPPKTIIKYGGVNSDGWKILKGIGTFKNVKEYPTKAQ